MKWLYNIKYFFEKHGFEVSSRLADRLGMKAKNVRLFFIYVSFATFGVWLQRILAGLNIAPNEMAGLFSRSFLISADCAHDLGGLYILI